jgi:raffinose/stachyose/melibiose transport system substrate-binding protein
MVDVLQKLQDLYTAGYCNADHLSSPYASGQVAIGEKKAAMVIQGEWFVSACQAAYPDVQLGSFAIPFIDGADNKIAIGAFVLGGYVCKGENEELAKQFLNYWSQPEQMALIYAKNDVYPAFVDCEGNKIDPSIENLVENYVKTGRYTYEFDSYFDSARPIMTDYLFGNIVECVAGSKTPEQALTDWNTKFEQYMAEMEYDGF